MSPISTSARMAALREGAVSWQRRHSSTAAIVRFLNPMIFLWGYFDLGIPSPPHIVGICELKDYTESRMGLGRFWRFFAQDRPKNRTIRTARPGIFAQDVFATTL